MTLVNPKPLGYAYGELLPSADVNSVFSQLENAVDGIGGGSYVLTNPLSLSGDTVTIDTLVSTTATIDDVTATTVTLTDLTVLNMVLGDLTIQDDLNVGGDTLVGALGVAGTITGNDADLASVTATDAEITTGDLTVTAGNTFLGPTIFRFYTDSAASADDTISYTVVKRYTGSGSHVTTLDSGAPVGSFFMLKNTASATRDISDGGVLATMSATTGFALGAKLGTGWVVFLSG